MKLGSEAAAYLEKKPTAKVSVPLRGNLYETQQAMVQNPSSASDASLVSVPLRGNLYETYEMYSLWNHGKQSFPSPCGEICMKHS